MKKILSMILFLAMLFGCTAATAETEKEYITSLDVNGVFELRGTLPAGYRLEEVVDTDSIRIVNITAGKDRPLMVMSIAFDELYADVGRLNDLDPESKKVLEESFKEEETVEISYTVTDYGTELITVREAEGTADFVSFFTIYKGYEIEFTLVAPQNESGEGPQGLTEDQLRMTVQFISDLDFVAAD